MNLSNRFLKVKLLSQRVSAYVLWMDTSASLKAGYETTAFPHAYCQNFRFLQIVLTENDVAT